MFGHSEFNMKYRKDYYCSTEFFYFNQIYKRSVQILPFHSLTLIVYQN
jgi:hypothetical protein